MSMTKPAPGGVHARGRTTVAGWSPLGFDPLVKRPSSFETGPPESALLYDELVVMDQRRVALKYALVVERVEKA